MDFLSDIFYLIVLRLGDNSNFKIKNLINLNKQKSSCVANKALLTQ